MDHDKILQSLSDLYKAIKSGEENEMQRRAFISDDLFNKEVPDPFKDYECAMLRFEYAKAMTAFMMKIGDISQAGTLRNRIIAHYQVIRKSKDYTVQQKHELKTILREIKENTYIPQL